VERRDDGREETNAKGEEVSDIKCDAESGVPRYVANPKVVELIMMRKANIHLFTYSGLMRSVIFVRDLRLGDRVQTIDENTRKTIEFTVDKSAMLTTRFRYPFSAGLRKRSRKCLESTIERFVAKHITWKPNVPSVCQFVNLRDGPRKQHWLLIWGHA
jgi:hypothetical protein